MAEENTVSTGSGGMREVPVDWEALEDAFENNAPEVHSYLHLSTGEVLRIVDGVADPQMHARIASDANYIRIDPVSSREQYRWMERYIAMVEDAELRAKLTTAIDGKGAFRRFKDVLMSHGPERERWFAFRSERLRIFMEAWLSAHALVPVPRTITLPHRGPAEAARSEERLTSAEARETRRNLRVEALRKSLRELAETLGPRDLETLASFAEVLKARRAARNYGQHHGEPSSPEPVHGGESSSSADADGREHQEPMRVQAAGGEGMV